GWLPRLGMIRETCQLLDIAQSMETQHPVGQGAVTEYDRLFGCGYQAIVRSLVASAEDWDRGRGAIPGGGKQESSPGDPLTAKSSPIENESRELCSKIDSGTRPSDSMLIEALEDLTESQLSRWLAHSKTLRLSVVERVVDKEDWDTFVAFVDRYGKDLFTQKF